YLYSLMYEAYKNGKPVIRPLFLEFQHDTRCYENEFSTFMFGPAVLVANIIEKGAQTRKLYLPKGEVWYDINNNFKKYKGGQIIEVFSELNSIPMFLRESGIFITTTDINKSNPENLNILVGGGINEGQYYFNDDGVTKNYESNAYEKIQIAVNGKERKKITFNTFGSYSSNIDMIYLEVVSKNKGALWVTLENENLERYLNESDWEEAEEGWYYSLSNRIINIKFKKPLRYSFDVIVSTEKFDLIGMDTTE